MQIVPNTNVCFTPSPAPVETTDIDHFANGIYAYINADKDPELQKKADVTFGRTVPFDNSEQTATLIGRAFSSRTGYRQNPLQYLRDNKLPVPPNWSGENYQLYTQIGQHLISKSQEHYNNAKAAHKQKLAEAQKDYTETMGALPQLIADSIRSEGGNIGTPLTPEYLEKLTKYGAKEGAIASQNRAALAWMYMSAYMDNVDSMQNASRNDLLNIADVLSNGKRELDLNALAAFALLMNQKATELQSSDIRLLENFADGLQNFWRTTNDQVTKTGIGTAFAVSSLPELQPTWGQQYQAPEYYGDERVEKLYGFMQQAISTSMTPSEKAEWYAKILSEIGTMAGESAIPMAAGVAASALTGGGALAAAAAGWAGGFAASAPSAINQAVAQAYVEGKVNPEFYGLAQGLGQAAAENVGSVATSLPLAGKIAGKLTNYAASRAAGSRFLANQYARTTLNYLTAGAFESVTELAEEEIGGFIGSKLNAIARSMGFEVSPQAYQLGETLKGMKSHEVAAIFGYSYALGMFGIPANFRSARNFAKNTDNLLKAGHTAKTARDIQHRAFQTEDKIAEIQADTSLSAEQKAEAIRKEEQNFATYQKTKFTNDVLSDPQFRSRLEKEGANIRDEAEVALDVEHEADIQILKEHNILEAVVLPGEKYRMSFYEEGELQADGTHAPGKITTQEWTRMQLTNWLMLQKDTRIEQDLRSFQALLLAHAHAQSATVEETKTHFQNLGANRPLVALGELHKNGMTPGFFQKAAQQALDLQRQHQAEGMTTQEAAQQPSPDFEGLSLGEVQNLATGAAQRKEQEFATTGALQNISDTTNVEYGGLNMLASDGTALIKYVAGRASILDILEERFEADIKQRTRGNKNLYNQLAETLLHIQSHLPGNIQLLDPKKKGNYTKSDFVEAYSKIALGAFLSNEKNLPINAAGHRLIQNIGRAVDTTRMFQTIGNAWLTYANSEEGKAHLAAGGQTIADIMQQAGFTFSNQLANARATAQQRSEVLESRNWQPAIEEELDALLEQAEEEAQLAEINQQEAKEPITIPADQSITGQPITIEPDNQSSIVNSQSSIVNPLLSLIQQGKAKTQDFARFFRDYPAITDAEATEQGIRPLTQKGNPTAAYTQGRLIAAKLTPQQFNDYINGKLKGKALKQALSEHGTLVPTTATESPDLFTDGVLEAQNATVTKPDVNFSIKAMHASPHNFRKFSTDFMGSGEGAQAYGWGLYFMTNTGVNKKYFNDFSIKRDTYLFDGKPMSRADIVSLFADAFEQIDKEYNAPKSAKDIAHTILWNLRDTQGGIKGAYSRQSALIEKRKKQQERNAFGVTNNLIKSSLAAHDVLKLLAEHDIQTHPATNYRVELNADDSNLLMWDERYSGQEIKDLLGEELFEQIYDEGDEEATLLDNGEGIYMLLRSVLGGKEAASKKLLESGVKGIKYLDGNSRSAGEGTYNYVIFSGDDIKITAVNETGVWSMDEGWEEYTDPTATFSIRAANPSTLDRFTADPLGERIVHTVRTEARRYARVLGDKTPQEQAMNAIASAESIIMAVDKYLHRPDKPVSRRHRDQLTKLRSIIEKYAQIIASGTPRSFKKISPAEQQELQAAIADLEAAELDTAETDPALLIEDDKRMNKRTREARSREHHRAIVREAAKGRVYKVLAAMLDTAADALDDYLKDQLLTKLQRLTATVAIKRTPSKRLKGKMTAPMYRELEQAIQLMAYSTRQKEDAIDTIFSAHETLAQAIASNDDNLTHGNTLLIELARQLEQEGTPVTAQKLTAALAAHEARVAIFADITSKNYEQTRSAANVIYHIIRYGRALWQQKHEAREAEIQTYLRHFLANTTAEQGTEQATRTASEKEQKESGLTRFANSMMNSMQLFHALSGIEALAPLMEHTQRSLATANVARDLHMKQMVTHVQAVYGRILGIKPATEAGYSDKQLKEISKKLDKFYAENNQREATGITRHYIDADGKPQQEELELTKWQALDLILTYRQQHYRPNAEHHGYTDKVLDSLEKWCGTNLMELGEAMQKSIINDGTIAVYEEREGIPLRENPLYWPGHLNIAEQDAPDHPVISNPYHGASSYKFLKGRTNNLREVSARNAYNVWKSAIAERANYVYLAPVTNTFNSLLARKEFAARLKTIIGPSLYHQLKETLREIDGTTWAETSLQEDPHGAVARALRNMAPALLAGNPTTLIRQASAVANATLMPDFPPHEFAKQLVQLQQNQSGITIGHVARLRVFQARARDNSALNEMLTLGTDAKYSSYANLARKAMGVIDYVDTICNAVGATLYYNYKYEQYTRENNENGNILTDAEIHAKCENDIAIMLALTAQPLKRTDKSAFFWRNSKTVLGPLYLYMGSELINKVGMARANWIKRKAEGMGSLKNTGLWLYSLGAGVGAVAFLTELAVAYLTGNTPDDDDSLSAWLIATYLNSAYGQYTSQMPVIGQITDLFTSPYSALFSTTSQIPGVKTIQSGKKIGKMLTDNKVYSGAEWQAEITRLARDLNGVAGYAGGINSHMPWLTVTSSILQSLTAAMNAVYFISTGARNDAFYADWLLPDWYKETSSRRSKRTSKPRRSKRKRTNTHPGR